MESVRSFSFIAKYRPSSLFQKNRAARGSFCALTMRSSRNASKAKYLSKKIGTPLKRSSSDQNAFVPEIRLFAYINLFKIAAVIEILIVRHKFPPGDPFFHAFLFN